MCLTIGQFSHESDFTYLLYLPKYIIKKGEQINYNGNQIANKQTKDPIYIYPIVFIEMGIVIYYLIFIY